MVAQRFVAQGKGEGRITFVFFIIFFQFSPDLDGSVAGSNNSIKGNRFYTMDSVVDSLDNAYKDFVDAATNVLEAKENDGSNKTTTDSALENFKQKWESFKVACDQAEEFVDLPSKG
ncbi:Mediator of RNA polymerase II transcription subunit 32 [Spatholobus suberectus]|nr:Mediator of RNA polymerase II transcription subunit 32 [Spatholobus suberectus]